MKIILTPYTKLIRIENLYWKVNYNYLILINIKSNIEIDCIHMTFLCLLWDILMFYEKEKCLIKQKSNFFYQC